MSQRSSSWMRSLPSGRRLAVVLAAALAALVSTSTTGAAPPCADAVLADWLDNSRIDRLYDLPCYEAAIDAIPTDLRDYTDAEEVIARAFQDASGRRLQNLTPSPDQRDSVGPTPAPAVAASASRAVPIPLLVLAALALTLLVTGGLGYVSRRRRGLR
jgi:hypothetical protein